METLPPAPPLMPDDNMPGQPVAAPGAAPIVFEDTQPRVVDHAANARREAVHAAPFEWEGKALSPFTPFVEDWWNILRERDGLPPWDEIIEKASNGGNQRLLRPDAVKILWLCVHGLPAGFSYAISETRRVDLRHHQDRWLDLINLWGDEHIGTDDAISAASTLAIDILKRSRLNRAVPRASGSGAPGE